MVTKICTQCKKRKRLDKFYRERSTCRDCTHDYYQGWYSINGLEQNNKERVKKLAHTKAFGRSVAGPIEWLVP